MHPLYLLLGRMVMSVSTAKKPQTNRQRRSYQEKIDVKCGLLAERVLQIFEMKFGSGRYKIV